MTTCEHARHLDTLLLNTNKKCSLNVNLERYIHVYYKLLGVFVFSLIIKIELSLLIVPSLLIRCLLLLYLVYILT